MFQLGEEILVKGTPRIVCGFYYALPRTKEVIRCIRDFSPHLFHISDTTPYNVIKLHLYPTLDIENALYVSTTSDVYLRHVLSSIADCTKLDGTINTEILPAIQAEWDVIMNTPPYDMRKSVFEHIRETDTMRDLF